VGAEPLVSVVIPTHSRRPLLERTLASLALQDYPADRIEVVVADDASTDDTPGFLERLDAPWRLRTARHDVNRGRAAARNTALELATGDIVLFIDDDMRCEPDLVGRHVACHAKHPDTAFIGTALTAPELGRSTVATYYDGMGVHRLAAGAPAPARYFVTNNASVPAAALRAVGGFDASFRRYGFEDCELGFRLERAGIAFRHCPGAVAHHMESLDLDDFLRRRREAPHAIVALIEKHPDRAGDLPVTILMPPAPDDPASIRLKKALLRLATAEPFCALARWAARTFWWRSLSVPIVTYLVACEYRRGLPVALRDARTAR